VTNTPNDFKQEIRLTTRFPGRAAGELGHEPDVVARRKVRRKAPALKHQSNRAAGAVAGGRTR
jgi:hypothetical protein